MVITGPPTHASTTSHFGAIPWCSSLLSTPNLTTLIPPNRTPKPTTEDSLISTTLATRDAHTIPFALTFYPRPTPSATSIPSLSTLFTLGDGLNGFPHTLHGGLIATLLDEGMGILLTQNADLAHIRLVAEGKTHGESAEGMGQYTTELNIRYLRPVATPGTVLVRAWMDKQEGRKLGVGAEVCQWEEKNGKAELRTCASAQGVFVEPRFRSARERGPGRGKGNGNGSRL